MKGIYFASFYFRVWDLTREIRENKNPAKISTYTVVCLQVHPENLHAISFWQNFCTEYTKTIVYFYLEFKLRYLKNLKLFSIRVKELFEPIA